MTQEILDIIPRVLKKDRQPRQQEQKSHGQYTSSRGWGVTTIYSNPGEFAPSTHPRVHIKNGAELALSREYNYLVEEGNSRRNQPTGITIFAGYEDIKPDGKILIVHAKGDERKGGGAAIIGPLIEDKTIVKISKQSSWDRSRNRPPTDFYLTVSILPNRRTLLLTPVEPAMIDTNHTSNYVWPDDELYPKKNPVNVSSRSKRKVKDIFIKIGKKMR